MFSKVLVTIFVLVIAICFVCTNVTQAQIVEKGLVSYWSLDKADIKGKTVKDVRGKNDGTIDGAPKTVEGKLGEGLEFNGKNDYVEVKDNPSLNFGKGDFTMSVWVKYAVVAAPMGVLPR